MALLNSILDRVNTQGRGMIVKIRQDLRGAGKSASGSLIQGTIGMGTIIGSRVIYEGKAPEHYIFVDKGRRAGAKMPPIKPIQQWIKQRGLDLNAFAVARSIAKKGIKPTNIYTNAIVDFKKGLDISDLVTKEIVKEIKIK